MSITLYHNPVSTCSQKVRLVLAEKELSYESYVIEWTKMDHLSDWYLKINPNGVVPAIMHDGNPVIDSSVIAEYLDETFPENPLGPRDPLGRAQMRAWMRYFEEVPTTAIRVPSFNKLFKKTITAFSDEAHENMLERMPLRKQMYKEFGKDGFDEAKYDGSMERLTKTMQRVAKVLDTGQDWLVGNQYSIADIVLLPTVVRMVDLHLTHLWDDYPAIQAWLDRAMARPSFDIAYYDGTRLRTEYETLK